MWRLEWESNPRSSG